MNVAITGATGFLGGYLAQTFAEAGCSLRLWHRPATAPRPLAGVPATTEWMAGTLGSSADAERLVDGMDLVLHAALDRPGKGFRGAEGDVVSFVRANVLGTLELVEAALRRSVSRFIFISTCAVHERILDDRPLDEKHPVWPTSFYGAHKGAIEQFVHAYGFGRGYPICSLRPCGIFGIAHPIEESRWFDLVRRVVQGETVTCTRGGKEVHAADVARAALVLARAPGERIAGESFNCCDRYISEWDIAHRAREVSGSKSRIEGSQTRPKNQIVTAKLQSLGFSFDGDKLFDQTIRDLVSALTPRA